MHVGDAKKYRSNETTETDQTSQNAPCSSPFPKAVFYGCRYLSYNTPMRVDEQRALCQRICDLEDISIVREFKDVSETRKRENLHAALEYCCQNSISYLIVENFVVLGDTNDVIRLVRNAFFGAGTDVITAQMKTEFDYCEPPVDSAAQEDSLIEEEEDQRIINGMRRAARLGILVHRPPVGLRVIKPKPRIIHDPQRAPLVREAYILMSTGRYTLSELTTILADKGLKNPQTGKPYRNKTILRMLSNPIYAGMIRIDEECQTVHSQKIRPIVDMALWWTVQRVLLKQLGCLPE